MANEDNGSSSDQIQGASPPAPDVPANTKGRGAFDARSKRSGSGPKAKIYVIIGLVIVTFLAVLIGVWVYLFSRMGESTTKIDESTVKADATLQVDRVTDQSMADAKKEVLRKQEAEEERLRREQERQQRDQNKGAPAASAPASGSPASGPAQNPGPRPPTPAERKMGIGLVMTPKQQGVGNSGVTVAGSPGGDGSSAPGSPGQLPQADGQGDASGLMGSRSRGNLGNLSGTAFAPSKAFMGPARKYLLARRTYLRCALYTEIITEQPGLTECRLTDPIYSADGSTVLAEAGAKLFGEQHVELKPGQARVFTAWTELEVQEGVRVPLNSLGAGPMGASGTEGWIDNHWKERFGGAALLTIMQDGLQSLSNLTQPSSGSGGYTINNTEQNVESMATKALESTINIQPTGHLSPGTVLTVIVARDVDFSSVYLNR